jgi:protein gp37
VRDLRDACAERGVAFFHKQGNGPRPGMDRVLDGRTWDEMPALERAA